MSLDISRWLGREVDAGGSLGTRRIATEACEIGPKAIDAALPAFVADGLGSRRPLLVWDDVTEGIAGVRVRDALSGQGLDASRAWSTPDHGHGPTCDGDTVDALTGHISNAGADAVVAVGSGTVNDVAKAGAGKAGVPYVVVPTAASMNGYTSSIAALLQDGVKLTLPFPAVRGVFADPAMVGRAPREMTCAGLGDLLSKSVCGADWRLAHLLQGADWSPLPGELVYQAESASIDAAEGIGRGAPEAMATLLEALLLSGISMVLAGSSAPASGAEHLFSHMIDMRRHVRGQTLNLHGAQVGVGTLITAALYEALLALPVRELVDPDRLEATHPSQADEEARIRRDHGPLAEGILAQYEKKRRSGRERRAFVVDVLERWDEVREAARETVRPLSQLRGALEAAGAPVTMAALGVGGDEARELFLVARDMRARYTVLDLAWDLGLLEGLRDEVLELSGVLR